MAMVRGITTQDILSYELLITSPLFYGDITTKLEKEKLLASFEESLTQQDYSLVNS